MIAKIQLGDMAVDVIQKDIKNVHLSVHPPTGRVTIAAPAHMAMDTIRVFAITKLAWIRKQQTKLRLGVKAERLFIQRMKTKWGSCNHHAHTIRLNTDLAKKPPECLEYLVVHELVHLLEPTHNTRFVALMSQHMPKWRSHQDALNRLPVRHESWEY